MVLRREEDHDIQSRDGVLAARADVFGDNMNQNFGKGEESVYGRS